MNEFNSAARPFQAAADAISGPDPGPEYILAEVTSGGNAPKSNIRIPLLQRIEPGLRMILCSPIDSAVTVN